MANRSEDARERLSRLSSSSRRLLDYVAVLEGAARYEVLRHLARVSEEDMIVDLREAVEAGVLAAVAGQPNMYDFSDEQVREFVLAQVGAERLPRLRARARAARQRVQGDS